MQTFKSLPLYFLPLLLTVMGCDAIRIFPKDAPDVAFSTTSVNWQAPCEVSFNNTSVGKKNTYKWDFGDGSTSTEVSPRHTYTQPGDYVVYLNATNKGGTDQTSQRITIVYPKPKSLKLDYVTISSVPKLNTSTSVVSTISVTDIFGNVLVTSSQRTLTGSMLPVAMSLDWDTEAAITDMNAEYRIIYKVAYAGTSQQEITLFTPSDYIFEQNPTIEELYDSNSVMTAKIHFLWSY